MTSHERVHPPGFLRRWTPVLIAAVMAAVMIGGFAIVLGKINSAADDTHTLVTLIRGVQKLNAPKVDEAKNAAQAAQAGVDILNDCLTPGGDCYEQGQANQAKVLQLVADLFRFTILCNDDPATPKNGPAMKACVDRMMRGQADGSTSH